MSEQKINPELMLKAAQLAKPMYEWDIVAAGDGHAVVIRQTTIRFDPRKDDSEAWAIMCALLKLSWRFRYENGGSSGDIYWAEHPHNRLKIWSGEMNRLMLCAVSAQTGLELFGEGE